MFSFHTFFDEVSNRQILPSTYMVNDPRYTVADQLGAGMEVRRGTADDVVEES